MKAMLIEKMQAIKAQAKSDINKTIAYTKKM